MFSRGPMPVPPQTRQTPGIPQNDFGDAPPPIPRRGGGRLPPPPVETERTSDPLPGLPPRGPPQVPDFDEDEDAAETYLDPTEATQGHQAMQNQPEEYEDPELISQQPPPLPAMGHQNGSHTPNTTQGEDSSDLYAEADDPPPSTLTSGHRHVTDIQEESTDIYSEADDVPPPPPAARINKEESMDIYSEADDVPPPVTRIHKPASPAVDSSEIYSEADEPMQQQLPPRKGMAQRQVPTPPQQTARTPPRQAVPNIPVPEPALDTYEDPEALVGENAQNQQGWAPQPVPPIPNTRQQQNRALPPEPVANDNTPLQDKPKIKKPPGMPTVDTLRLRQTRQALTPVNNVFRDPQPDARNNNEAADDEEDDGTGGGGVLAILAKLGKKSSMFRSGVTKGAENRPKPAVNPATRKLPDHPATSSTQLSDASNQSISDDNSSGSGSVPPRKADDRLPPLPQPLPQPSPQERTAPVQVGRIMIRPVEEENYYQNVDRTETDIVLDQQDRMYLVRSSKLGGPGAPYTLCVYYNNRVWNLKIRLKQENCYALGTEHPKEKTFTSVTELITYHRSNPITLAGRTDSGQVILGDTPNDLIYDSTMQ